MTAQSLYDSFILEFQRYLKNGSNDMGIMVSDHQAALMALHAKELIKWNKKINLTAIKGPLKIAEKHFIDSIAVLSFLENEKTLLDMGTGGGFPGIPIKIMNPLLSVVLVDASRKKVNFLKHVIRTLKLENIDAIHSRVEDLHKIEQYNCKFDAVISRAFTNLSGFVMQSAPFLKKEGRIYAMKGKYPEQEMTSPVIKKFKLKVFYYKLPFEQSNRCLVKLTGNLNCIS